MESDWIPNSLYDDSESVLLEAQAVRTANETTQNNKKYLCLYSYFRDKANVVKRRLITEALLRCVLIVPFRGDEECASVVTVLD